MSWTTWAHTVTHPHTQHMRTQAHLPAHSFPEAWVPLQRLHPDHRGLGCALLSQASGLMLTGGHRRGAQKAEEGEPLPKARGQLGAGRQAPWLSLGHL